MIMQRMNLKSRWIWMLFDLLLIYLASYLAWYIRYELRWFRNIETGYYSDLQAYSLLFVGLSVVLLLAFNANQVYNIRRSTSWVDEVYRLTNGVFVGTIFVMAATFGLRPLAFSRLLFLYDAVLIIGPLGGRSSLYA